jgi:hypothetical protein
MVLRMLPRVVLATWFLGALAAQETPPPIPEQSFELGPFDHLAGPLELGVPPPAPTWGAWRRGEPIELGAANAPRCTLFAFYPWPKQMTPNLAGDADYLALLQRRFADRGVRVVLAIGDPDLPIASSLDACGVVVDEGLRTAADWGVVFSFAHILAVDQGGNTVFQGGLDGDVVDALERVLDGRFVAASARDQASQRRYLIGDFESIAEPSQAALVERLLGQASHDGLLWGCAYVAAVRNPGAAESSAAVCRKALAALRDEPRPLAVFIDLALRCDAKRAAFAAELANALQPAIAGAPRDAIVQLAYLRALVLADQGREVGRQVARIRKLVQGSLTTRFTFAEILLQDAMPAVHRDLVQQVLQGAAKVADEPRWMAIRYLYEQRCAEDKEVAKDVLDRFVDQTGSIVDVNNACWYLMTEMATMGCCRGFAVALAERMLEQRDTLEDFCLDTAALAMFLAGRYAEAVELEGAAVLKSGAANPEYVARCKRYEAAAAAAPR